MSSIVVVLLEICDELFVVMILLGLNVGLSAVSVLRLVFGWIFWLIM